MTAAVVSRFRLVALVLPLVIVGAGAAVQVLLIPSLPDPVAIHWGVDGTPDGFAPAWVAIAMFAVVAAVVPLSISLLAVRELRAGGGGPTYRFLGALALALSTFVTVLGTASLAVQRDLATARAAPGIGPYLVAAAAAAGASGVVGWLLLPAQAAVVHPRVRVPAVAVAGDADVQWSRTTTPAHHGSILAGAGVVLVAGVVGCWIVAPLTVAVIVTGLAVVLAGVVAALTSFTVRVDRGGLSVRSSLGMPRFVVPVADVVTAAVTTVDPIGQFGGYGLRGTPRRFGVIVRRGEALVVTRTDGRELTVTVEDATTAAGLLNALRSRLGD